MRVSSDAPALSRRSIMKGLACGLAGAAVPVAAIAGMTASRLISPDATIIESCERWKTRKRDMERKERLLTALSDEARRNEPAEPRELYEPLRVRGHQTARPFSKNAAADRSPWTKAKLGKVLARRVTILSDGKFRHLPEADDDCRAHVCRLMRLIDEHKAAKDRAWAGYNRLDRAWTRLLRKNDRLLTEIAETEAQTLQGAAAQIEVLQADHQFSAMLPNSPHSERIMSNLLRLVAALPVEA